HGELRQGASTITQQVVKNLLLSSERTFRRKVRELILARRLEQELTKDEILWLYLNHINFGHGRYGVQEASRFYFGKSVDRLTLAEAALLAGLPQAPTRLSPRTNPAGARRRRDWVLGQMAAKQFVPEADVAAARATEIRLVDPPEEGASLAPEVMEIVRDELRERVGRDALVHGGFTVHTTIDLELQRTARDSLRRGLESVDRRQHFRGPLRAPEREAAPPTKRGARARRPSAPRPLPRVAELRVGSTYEAEVTGADDASGHIALDVGGHRAVARMSDLTRFNPDRLSASAFAPAHARTRVSILSLPDADRPATARLELGPEGAVVVIDPRTRGVLALVGGYDGRPGGFDRATQALRQPGSAMKPFVYAAALRARRYTAASLVDPTEQAFDRWRPRNYESWDGSGPVRVREALAKSVNLVAVRMIMDVGPRNVAALAQTMGITSPLEATPPLALGASEVRPIELANAYAVFATGGQWAPYHVVTRVTGPDGGRLALPDRPVAREVITPAESYLMTSLMRSVVTDGTARGASRLGRPAAGKTGTSNDVRDTWFVGYTPEVVAAVWVGFDDRRPLGRRESGGSTAVPIWTDVVRAATHGEPVVEFPRPEGVVPARIDPATGRLAYFDQPDAIEELFLDGTVPTEVAVPDAGAIPTDVATEDAGVSGNEIAAAPFGVVLPAAPPTPPMPAPPAPTAQRNDTTPAPAQPGAPAATAPTTVNTPSAPTRREDVDWTPP
ncbi:MAG: transglycosylase domain-containing protein, partial [Deltaproteobacteria bacterium]|nr:transglycosylase domain-containing protein [Deltaproteobacteria bacterium]